LNVEEGIRNVNKLHNLLVSIENKLSKSRLCIYHTEDSLL